MERSRARIHGHASCFLSRSCAADRERPYEGQSCNNATARSYTWTAALSYDASPEYSNTARHARARWTSRDIPTTAIRISQRRETRSAVSWSSAGETPALVLSPSFPCDAYENCLLTTFCSAVSPQLLNPSTTRLYTGQLPTTPFWTVWVLGGRGNGWNKRRNVEQ